MGKPQDQVQACLDLRAYDFLAVRNSLAGLHDSLQDFDERSFPQLQQALAEKVGIVSGHLQNDVVPALQKAQSTCNMLLGQLSGSVDDQGSEVQQKYYHTVNSAGQHCGDGLAAVDQLKESCAYILDSLHEGPEGLSGVQEALGRLLTGLEEAAQSGGIVVVGGQAPATPQLPLLKSGLDAALDLAILEWWENGGLAATLSIQCIKVSSGVDSNLADIIRQICTKLVGMAVGALVDELGGPVASKFASNAVTILSDTFKAQIDQEIQGVINDVVEDLDKLGVNPDNFYSVGDAPCAVHNVNPWDWALEDFPLQCSDASRVLDFQGFDQDVSSPPDPLFHYRLLLPGVYSQLLSTVGATIHSTGALPEQNVSLPIVVIAGCTDTGALYNLKFAFTVQVDR